MHKHYTVFNSAEASHSFLSLHQLLACNSYTLQMPSCSPPLLRVHLLLEHGASVPLAMLPAATLEMTLA